MSEKRSIEIATLLQDSIIDVKHLVDPRGGSISRFTWGLFVAAGVLLLLAVCAVGVGYVLAAENDAAYKAFVEGGGAAMDFRPEKLGWIWDASAAVGFVGGLMSLAWGLARRSDEREAPTYRVGRGRGVELPTELAAVDSFPLVAPAGDGFVFRRLPGMTGDVVIDGRLVSLEEAPAEIPIQEGTRIRAVLGETTLIVSSVPAPARSATPLFANAEGRYFGYLGGAAAAVGLLVLILWYLPPDGQVLTTDWMPQNERIGHIDMQPTEPPLLEPAPESTLPGAEEGGSSGQKEAGDEGRLGSKESKNKEGLVAIKKNGVPPQLARERLVAYAQNAGILGRLRAQGGGAFATLTGTADFSSGLDDRDIYGGFIGLVPGEAEGGFGTGVKGYGPGGGGDGLNTIGTGPLGRMGRCCGNGPKWGVGVGDGPGGPRRQAREPVVELHDAVVPPDYDRSLVRRKIRDKLLQFRHCYERELVVQPDLEGTVVTHFVIATHGGVIQADASGMGHERVESCVAGVIRTIGFPRPPTVVKVTYPFTFRPAAR